MLYPLRESDQQYSPATDSSPLPEEELTLVRKIDSVLAPQLESINRIAIDTFSLIGSEYFALTDEGFTTLQQLLDEYGTDGIPIEALRDRTSYEELDILLRHILGRIDFTQIPEQKRNELAALCRNFANIRVAEELSALLSDTGRINVSAIPSPIKYEVVLSPQSAVWKLARLRQIKTQLKEAIRQEHHPAARTLYTVYLQKVNVMIADIIPDLMLIADTAPWEIPEMLVPYLGMFSEEYSRERSLSRLDRYRYGASPMYGSRGDRYPLGRRMIQRGLDLVNHPYTDIPDMDNFSTEEFGENFQVNAALMRSLFEAVLLANNLLKSDTNQAGWSVEISPKARNLSVNGKKRTVVIPADFDRPFYSVNPKASVLSIVGHECVHVFQHQVRQRLGLELLNRIGAPRAAMSFEGGGVQEESRIQAELFQLPRGTNIHYLAAVIERLNGGNYIECVVAAYTAMMLQYPTQDRKKALANAIDSAHRIFRSHGNLSSHAPFVSNSEPLAYLEQSLTPLLDRFGAIPSSLHELVELGIIDRRVLDEIENSFITADQVLTPDRLRDLHQHYS